MKKLFFILSLIGITLLQTGCKSEKIQVIETNSDNTSMGSSFNQETYIWESFLFPTNRTTGKQ